MNVSNTDETAHADALRETMIGKLREMGAIRSDRVAEVFRAMPRHLFTPGAPLEAAAEPEGFHARDRYGIGAVVPARDSYRCRLGGACRGGWSRCVRRCQS